MKRNSGFALLDVMLAVVLIAVASYATFRIAKSFQTSSSVQQVEEAATNIAQNFLPYLQDSSDASMVMDSTNDLILTDYLKSIAVPTDQIVSSTATFSYLYTGVYVDGTQTQMNFEAVYDASGAVGANYLIMGFKASPAHANQLTQDLGGTFSVFHSSGSITGAVTGLVDPDDSTVTSYSVYLVFPKSGSTVPAGATLTAV